MSSESSDSSVNGKHIYIIITQQLTDVQFY